MDAVIVDAERLMKGFALFAVVQSEPKILTLEWWMTTARIVLTTIGKQQDAEKLALQLVERRLAACVNIVGPIRSVYRWKQKISNEPEYLLVIKTTAELAAQLRSAFKQLHPYELPECVELAVQGGSEDYLAWLAGEVSG
ncbi:MAG: divalent-cation tolerance protein CutA [Candidatus Korobacteraceae bacterium]|jgi:periplasmic divalent cation tolerance protein